MTTANSTTKVWQNPDNQTPFEKTVANIIDNQHQTFISPKQTNKTPFLSVYSQKETTGYFLLQ